MDYPLAKALKDAGFHQSGNGTRVAPPDKIVARRDDFAYVPTLDELVEACGMTFGRLEKNGSFSRFTMLHDAWVAIAPGGSHETGGSTAIEAVARLWLALNEKGDAT